MKKRIAYFAPEFPGQTHAFMWREYQALLDLGMSVDLVSTQCPPKQIISHSWSQAAKEATEYLVPFTLTDYLGAGLEIIKAGPVAWWRCLKSMLGANDLSITEKLRLPIWILMAGKLIQNANQKAWTHIHVSSCANAANIAMFSKLLGGPDYSISLLGPRLEDYGPNQPQKWQHAKFALIMSDLLLQDVKQKLAGYLPNKMEVAPVGVNLSKMKREHPYIAWNGDEPCRLYACGRLNLVKGYSYLIETIEILKQEGWTIKLRIAGEDEQGGQGYRQDVEQLIQSKGLSDEIELLGAVSSEQNRQENANAHVYVQASLDEGVSVAIMEAMAMEIPVVVTDVGGNYELVDNGVNGIMVPPQNPQLMAEKIVKILRNPELAQKLSQKSREKVADKFHHRRSADIMASFLSTSSNQEMDKNFAEPVQYIST